ncbi:MAG: DUF6531 domain-containing protein [Thermodesulfobacteriota bacterium]|nr:DUF6531 domain-containing protein [Thermodesulfobacteriota bacterium]
MSDDFYRLRLTAYDYEHSSSTWIECTLNDPVKLGRFSITYDDLTLPVMVISIQIRRTYDSTRRTEGDFGIGWSLDIKTMEIREDANHNVFITLPNGRRATFDFTPEQLDWWPFFLAKYTAPAGVSDELEIADADRMLMPTEAGWFWMFEGSFDPDTYVLKTKAVKRQAYGYRDMEFFKLKILGLRETIYVLVG